MTWAEIRTWVNTKITSNGAGLIDATAVRTAFVELITNTEGVVTTWLKVGTANTPANNTDDTYRTGKLIVGRTTDNGTGASLQTQGSIHSEAGYFAPNADGSLPPVVNSPGNSLMRLLANWISGQSDLAFVNTNTASSGFTFWRMVNSSSRQLLLTLRAGSVGIGIDNPLEALDVVGRVRSLGVVFSGNAPTIATGPGLGTSPVATLGTNSVNMAGQLTIRSGGSPTANAVLATVTLSAANSRAVRVLATPASSAAASNTNRIWFEGSTTGFTVRSGSTGVDTGVDIVFNYWLVF